MRTEVKEKSMEGFPLWDLKPINNLEIETIDVPLFGNLEPIDYMKIDNPCRININVKINSELPSKEESAMKIMKMIQSCETIKQIESVQKFLTGSHIFTESEKEGFMFVIAYKMKEILDKDEKL